MPQARPTLNSPLSDTVVLGPDSALPVAELVALETALGTHCTLVDATSGDVIHQAAELPGGDWALWGTLCREVASRGSVELIDEREPLCVMAVPLSGLRPSRYIAVAVFLTRALSSEPQRRHLARLLGTSEASAERWAQRQSLWSCDSVAHLAAVVQSKRAADARAETLQSQVEKLSQNLASTYEEISLLFRLTENLRLSEGMDTLGARALEWLRHVVPAEGLAAEFSSATRLDHLPGDRSDEPEFITHGEFPLTHSEFSELAHRLDVRGSRQPVVLNPNAMENARANELGEWTMTGVRNLVIVPLAAGDKIFGYLAAANHTGGGEFGTVEARLLASVATILAIHSGNIVLYREQAELLSGVVRALSSAIDAKDPYTCGHSDRVARVAVRLGEQLGLSQEMRSTLYLAGLLHDVGKIGISDEVLRKPGKLTPAEYEHVKLHPTLGYKILRDLKKIEHVLPAVLYHHESWDGHGYPQGLSGEKIPLIARIIAVADAFDAMGSDRPYRQGMNDDTLDEILHSGAGQQWDARVIDAFFQAREEMRRIASRERESLNPESQPWT